MKTASGIHDWWANDSAERFWIEVTDRSDLGTNLKAPQTNEKEKDFWSYSILNYVRPGDIVFHYKRSLRSILAFSRATGELWEDRVLWAARGTYARDAGVKPHLRDGWYVGLESFTELSEPVTLDDIRGKSQDVLQHLTNLEQAVGRPVYFPFESGTSRPIRPLQGYLFKLPSTFVGLFPQLAVSQQPTGAKSKQSETEVGAPYREADEETSVSARDPFSTDPALVERGARGHARTQNLLAEYVRGIGHEPRSPLPAEPNFDLAWQWSGVLWVVEVKSLTSRNEEKQMRLGLGQVLRYRHSLAKSRGARVECVLAAERKPVDQSWLDLCAELGVHLVWPGNFGTFANKG